MKDTDETEGALVRCTWSAWTCSIMGSSRRELIYPSEAGREGGVSGVFGEVDRFGEGDDDVDDMVQASVIALGCGPRRIQ